MVENWLAALLDSGKAAGAIRVPDQTLTKHFFGPPLWRHFSLAEARLRRSHSTDVHINPSTLNCEEWRVQCEKRPLLLFLGSRRWAQLPQHLPQSRPRRSCRLRCLPQTRKKSVTSAMHGAAAGGALTTTAAIEYYRIHTTTMTGLATIDHRTTMAVLITGADIEVGITGGTTTTEVSSS
jgi:hypothetical protein